jgi:hypothetical protein
MTQIQTQDEWVLYRLEQFYSKTENIERVKTILNGESPLSLRLIDWFVTNYSKKSNISYMTKNNRHIVVYLSYKSHLKAYSKRRFDPFCRWDRISIPYKNGTFIETTIGQLNFFKWALENKVIDYIEEHYDEIEKDMNNRNSTSKRKEQILDNNTKTRKKREELSVSATKSIKKEDIEIVVQFH